MLGAGFIGRFYADSIQGYRNKDKIVSICSFSPSSAEKFANDYNVPHFTTNLEESIARPDVDIVCIALPNFLHEEAVNLCCKYQKAVMITKPLGRNSEEAFRMLQAVEHAGIFNGYLEDLVYTPKYLKAKSTIDAGALGRIIWAKSREAHPGPHSEWFWDKEKAGGGCMLDLACHCIEICRGYIGKNILPVSVMCWADTQVKPIEAEDHAIGLVRYQNDAIGQFEASWAFRGGLDLRDEIMGTEGTIWTNNFLRTGMDIFTSGKGSAYISEKAETDSGWVFPVGDELNELGYNHMFMDMFSSFEKGIEPKETFYDGYVVNAIIDAAYKSNLSKQWEPVQLETWRGDEDFTYTHQYTSFDEQFFFIKEEVTHYGAKKLILKEKATGKIIERLVD